MDRDSTTPSTVNEDTALQHMLDTPFPYFSTYFGGLYERVVHGLLCVASASSRRSRRPCISLTLLPAVLLHFRLSPEQKTLASRSRTIYLFFVFSTGILDSAAHGRPPCWTNMGGPGARLLIVVSLVGGGSSRLWTLVERARGGNIGAGQN